MEIRFSVSNFMNMVKHLVLVGISTNPVGANSGKARWCTGMARNRASTWPEGMFWIAIQNSALRWTDFLEPPLRGNGVTNLLRYWLGEDGFGPYLKKIRAQSEALMTEEGKKVVLDPLVNNNPIALQVLGICSALAVTTTLAKSLIMCLALTTVVAFSSAAISLIRNHIPSSIRIIIQMTVIASFVIVVDEVLKAFAYELSKQLSVFVGLIITNCIVLGTGGSLRYETSRWPQLLGWAW